MFTPSIVVGGYSISVKHAALELLELVVLGHGAGQEAGTTPGGFGTGHKPQAQLGFIAVHGIIICISCSTGPPLQSQSSHQSYVIMCPAHPVAGLRTATSGTSCPQIVVDVFDIPPNKPAQSQLADDDVVLGFGPLDDPPGPPPPGSPGHTLNMSSYGTHLQFM